MWGPYIGCELVKIWDPAKKNEGENAGGQGRRVNGVTPHQAFYGSSAPKGKMNFLVFSTPRQESRGKMIFLV